MAVQPSISPHDGGRGGPRVLSHVRGEGRTTPASRFHGSRENERDYTMTAQVSMIAATAQSVAVAYVAHVASGEALSVAKFGAVVSMAASVAARLRVEHINTGEALETNKKGESVALIALSKEQRAAFAAAFKAADIGEKDADNIASMGRTVARRFVADMIANGFIRSAKSGDEMADALRVTLLELTGDKASYNELEKARARGWVVADDASDDATQDSDATQDDAPKADVDLSATLDTAPALPPVLTASESLDDEVTKALSALRAAVARDDWDRLNAAGFGSFLNDAKEAHKAFIEANAEAEKALANG